MASGCCLMMTLWRCVYALMTCHLEELCQIYVFVINSFFLSPTQKIDAQAIEEFYGLTSDISKNSESGYILFYQSRE